MNDASNEKCPAQQSSEALQVIDTFISPDDEQVSVPPGKKRGRKKGFKNELHALLPGGYGGRARRSIFAEHDDSSQWRLDEGRMMGQEYHHDVSSTGSDSDYSSDDDSSMDPDEEELGVIGEDEVDQCITDLNGTRLLPVSQLSAVIKLKMCCKRCALKEHKRHISNFLAFC